MEAGGYVNSGGASKVRLSPIECVHSSQTGAPAGPIPPPTETGTSLAAGALGRSFFEQRAAHREEAKPKATRGDTRLTRAITRHHRSCAKRVAPAWRSVAGPVCPDAGIGGLHRQAEGQPQRVRDWLDNSTKERESYRPPLAGPFAMAPSSKRYPEDLSRRRLVNCVL